MPSPFPGMDPYLEAPNIWPDVHLEMIRDIRTALNPRLLPDYAVRVETRVYVSHEDDLARRTFAPDVTVEMPSKLKRSGKVKVAAGLSIDEPLIIPYVVDPTIEEAYLEIKHRKTNVLVTVIEVLSPTNKLPGAGRDAYLTKQKDVWNSTVHLVEIDLLRGGEHTVLVPEWMVRDRRDYDYLVSVNRATNVRRRYETYPRSLRERLPRIGIPLAEGDRDVVLDVQAVVAQTYDAGSYQARLHYDQPCIPPLREADQAWANDLIRTATMT